MTNFFHKNAKIYTLLLYLVVFFGIIFRLNFFLSPRVLWIDEIDINKHLVAIEFSGVLKPKTAPIGFILIQKIIMSFFGSSDTVLRFFPFITGCFSILLMKKICDKLFSNLSVLFAISLFAVSWPLIYYSGEAKQYSVDVFVANLLILQSLNHDKRKYREIIFLNILAMWLSHPSLFIIAGLYFYRLTSIVIDKKTRIGEFIILAINFIAIFVINYNPLRSVQDLQNFWITSFMPMPPWDNYPWFLKAYERIVQFAHLGTPFDIAHILFLAGIFSLIKSDRKKLYIFILPILLTLVASAFKFYPFFYWPSDRMITFMVPLVIIIAAYGFEWIIDLNIFRTFKNVLMLLLVLFMLVFNYNYSSNKIKRTNIRYDIKKLMLHLSQNCTKNENIWVLKNGFSSFLYYNRIYNIKYKNLRQEQHSKEMQESEKLKFIRKISGSKVWLTYLGNFKEIRPHDDEFFRRADYCLGLIFSRKPIYFGLSWVSYYDLRRASNEQISSVEKCISTNQQKTK